MIHRIEQGQRYRYGINWTIFDKTYPRSLMIALVIPVWIFRKKRYTPEEWGGFPYEQIGRQLKVIGLKFTLQFNSWRVPFGKQEDVPMKEYYTAKENRNA